MTVPISLAIRPIAVSPSPGNPGSIHGPFQARGWAVERPARPFVRGQQLPDPPKQLGLAGAGPLDVGRPLLGRRLVQGGEENRLDLIGLPGHRHSPPAVCPPTMRNPAADHPTNSADFHGGDQSACPGSPFFSSAWSQARA